MIRLLGGPSDGTAGFNCGIAELKRLAPLNPHGWSKNNRLRCVGVARRRTGEGAAVLGPGQNSSRVRPERAHKGDMMSLVVKNYPRGHGGRADPAVQIASAGLCRRRAARGILLRQGLRRCDARLWREGQGERGCSTSAPARPCSSAILVEATGKALRPAATHRVHRYPAGNPASYQYFTEAAWRNSCCGLATRQRPRSEDAVAYCRGSATSRCPDHILISDSDASWRRRQRHA